MAPGLGMRSKFRWARDFWGVFLGMVFISSVIFQTACTARYSQSLSGAIPQVPGRNVQTSATGFTLFGIAISDPTPAHEQISQLMGGCKSLNAVEVDYREKMFFIMGIPKISVKATCELPG